MLFVWHQISTFVTMHISKFLQTGHTQVASLGFFYKASENTLIGLLNFLEGNIVKVKALWGITQLLFTKTYPGQEMSIFRRIVLH